MDSGLPTQLELSETEQRILVGALAGSSRAEISKNLSLGRGDWEAAWQHICFLLGVPDRKCALRLVAAYAVQSLGASSTSQTRLNAETQKRSLAEKRLNQMSVHTKTGGWQLDVATGEVSWTEGCYLVIGRDAKLPPLSAQEYAALVHPEDQARHRVALDRLFASCEPLDITYRLLLPTGEIYVHSAAHAERDENGEIVRFIGTVQDITELQLSREKDEESKRLFESIASSVPDLLYVLDVRTQKVTYANRSMGAMLGYDVDETAVMGASFFERLTHSEDKNIWSGHRETVMALSDGEFHRVEYRMWHNDGSWVTILCREGVFTRDVSGNPTQLIGVARDITVQRQADEKLRRNEQMMRRSFEDAPLGIALLSLSGQFESVNHSYCEIFGYRSSELVGESVAKVNGCEELEGFVEWLYGASSEPAPEPYRRERKAVRKDGVVAYVSEVASVVYDVNGKPSQIISQVQDITSRREAEERVGESDRRFQAALEALEDGVLLVDSSGLIQVANPTASELVGIAAEELLGTSIHDAKWQLVDELGNELPNEDRPLSRALCGERIEGLELRLQRPDETCFWIRVSAIPLYRDGFEQPYAAVASFLDISVEVEQRDHLVETMSHINDLNMQLAVRQRQLEEHQRDLEETNHQLQYLAVTDGLTGLRNHRRAQEFLDERVAEATRYNRPISIAMLDVDRFKQLNDDFGHLVGDKVLKELGRLLKAYIRNTDFVARYGGEEFLIVMPETCADAARSAAERIRRAIEGATWEERPITVSIGVATLGSATKTKELLLKQADRALYESKAAGRNCVSSYVAMRAHQAA